MEKESRAKKGMGGGGKKSSSKSGKHPHETHIRHFKNGGHVVTHHYKNDETGGSEPGEPDVMADKAALMAHLQASVPDNGPAQAAPSPDASAAAAPSAASGPAPAPAPSAQPMPGA